MNYINGREVTNIILEALKEDLGRGDITTQSFIPAEKSVKAVILAKEACVVCGLSLSGRVFKILDINVKFKALVKDGTAVKKGAVIAKLQGKARSILSAERVALNFLSHLCGVATKTRSFVKEVKPYKAKIIDTRKTLPGLRLLQKYAVRTGGGFNHRFSLDEMVMIKDNHRKVLGKKLWGIGLKKIKTRSGGLQMEIEVNNISEFKKALQIKPDIIMLDNMSVEDLRKAVNIRNLLAPGTHHPKPKLEASGGINLRNAKRTASTGVDTISIGELTHSVKSPDISLEIL